MQPGKRHYLNLKQNGACLTNHNAIASCKGIYICKIESNITSSSWFFKGILLQLDSSNSNWHVQKAFPQPSARSWACLATTVLSTTANSHGMIRKSSQLQQICLVFQQLFRKAGFTCCRWYHPASAGIEGKIKSNSKYTLKAESLYTERKWSTPCRERKNYSNI